MRKHSQHNNDERTHFFRKIYLSHFIRNGCERVTKGLCERGELDTEQTAAYWPPVPLSLAALLSRSTRLLNRGSCGPTALCWVLVPSSASYLQLDWLQVSEPVCGPGLYNCLTATCFLWASHLYPIQLVDSQGYTLISSTGCTCSLIDGWVGGQYTKDIWTGKSRRINSKWEKNCWLVGWLVGWIYGISTFVGDSMPNSVYIYIRIQPKISKRILR